MTLYLRPPPFFPLFELKHKTEGLAASRLLHLLVCWISKGRAIFALQRRNVPRSGLYIMSRYEKAVSGAGAHEINTSWPLAPSESITTLQHSRLLRRESKHSTVSINGITRRHKPHAHPPNAETNFQSARLSLFSTYAGGEMMPVVANSTIHHVLDTPDKKVGIPELVLHGVHSYYSQIRRSPVS